MSSVAISIMANLFEKLIYMELPLDNAWIEHLEVFNAVRINSLRNFPNLEDYYKKIAYGYTLAGINKNSKLYSITNLYFQK